MANWGSAKEEAESAGNGSAFVRMKSGDRVVGVFDWTREPTRRRVIWDGARSVDYVEERRHEYPPDSRPKTRYLMWFHEKGATELQIFDVSRLQFLDVAAVVEKHGDHTAIEVRRQGSTKDDTRWQYLYDGALTEQQAAALHKRFDEAGSIADTLAAMAAAATAPPTKSGGYENPQPGDHDYSNDGAADLPF